MGSDFEIIQEVLHGKRCLYGELVKKYQQQIYALGIKFFHNQEDAEDFSQEVFLKAYQQLHTFRGDSSFYTWLFRIGYFLGLSWNRRKRPAVPIPEDFDIPESSGGPEIQHFRKDAIAALRNALEELPERYRICLELYFTFGMTYQDISNITDIPIGTVKSHVFRAKSRLKDLLTGTVAEEPHDL